jgi:hypothetical protein
MRSVPLLINFLVISLRVPVSNQAASKAPEAMLTPITILPVVLIYTNNSIFSGNVSLPPEKMFSVM